MRHQVSIITIIVLMLFFSISSVAGDLSGKVTNIETNSLIKDANIKIVGLENVTSSDKHGKFLFPNLKDGKYSLVVTHISFDKSDTIFVELVGDKNINITLKPTPWVLNDVVVTGTRSPHLLKDVPVQTEVISRRDFQRTGATTVDEALSSSIGININEDLSGQGATIRGIEGDRVLILIDGERVVGRVRGSIDLGQFDLSSVEKIEVVKGTGSTLYGSDAMGGVINIITKKVGRDQTEGSASLEFGSFSSLNSSFNINHGTQKTGFLLGGHFYSTHGFDLDKSSPHTDGIEEIKQLNLNSKVKHRLSDKWNVSSSVRFLREKKDWIESEFFPPNITVMYNDDETNYRFDGSVNFDYLSGDKYSMNFRAFASLYDHSWNKINTAGIWVDTSETNDRFAELSYSANYVIGQNHVMTYGWDFFYQDLKSDQILGTVKADTAGDFYFQYEYSPNGTLNFLPGIRYERHSTFGGHFNPSINIMYKPSEELKFRSFVGKGFRAPSIKQQFFVFDHSAWGYIVYGGNVPLPDDVATGNDTFKELTEETSINSSISAEFSYGTIGLHRLTYFYNHLDGLIDFIPIDSSNIYRNGIYMYQNVENAITQGIEWESRVRLTSSIDLSFAYNYLYSRNLDKQHKLFNRPDHTFKLYFTSYWGKYNLGLSFWGDYASKKLFIMREDTGGSDVNRAEYAPHRTTLNLNIFKRFKKGLEAFVRIENLLDETNVDFHYWPGISVYSGFKYDFNLNK